jgi:hypothetical protein
MENLARIEALFKTTVIVLWVAPICAVASALCVYYNSLSLNSASSLNRSETASVDTTRLASNVVDPILRSSQSIEPPDVASPLLMTTPILASRGANDPLADRSSPGAVPATTRTATSDTDAAASSLHAATPPLRVATPPNLAPNPSLLRLASVSTRRVLDVLQPVADTLIPRKDVQVFQDASSSPRAVEKGPAEGISQTAPVLPADVENVAAVQFSEDEHNGQWPRNWPYVWLPVAPGSNVIYSSSGPFIWEVAYVASSKESASTSGGRTQIKIAHAKTIKKRQGAFVANPAKRMNTNEPEGADSSRPGDPLPLSSQL